MKIDNLYELYKKDIYYFIYSLSKNKDISEDITSEVFLVAIKSLPTFKGDSSIKTWLFGIARLKWLEFLRSQNKIQGINERLSLYINEVDFINEYSIFNKDIIDKITELLDKEPEKNKKIILMRTEGFSFREIGESVGISENSARVIDFRTKKKIKEILIKEGYTYE